jgi:hypothetical protein
MNLESAKNEILKNIHILEFKINLLETNKSDVTIKYSDLDKLKDQLEKQIKILLEYRSLQ